MRFDVVGGKEAQEIDARRRRRSHPRRTRPPARPPGAPSERPPTRGGEDRTEDDLGASPAARCRPPPGRLPPCPCRRRPRPGCRLAENRASPARRRCGTPSPSSPPLPRAERGRSSATLHLAAAEHLAGCRRAAGRARRRARVVAAEDIEAGAGVQDGEDRQQSQRIREPARTRRARPGVQATSSRRDTHALLSKPAVADYETTEVSPRRQA